MLRWETFPDPAGGFRWRALAGNGRVVAVSPDDYPTDRNARRAMHAFQLAARAPAGPSAAPAPSTERCTCAKPTLSKAASNICTACGRRRG